ncbi:TraR/DksA C4-type zinc finger protein [Afifella sp. IM 167]|uniref:TraR/DksA family transcriptional regulator n=1 Tax=Afifella sp. IM 167 TaxID=2033586 RepID=UPI001CCF8898|nr:TraR/DksA C4-type zinc finger protein [Afifella sp. IM 167]MBZ8133044.1 molecular chaperone DnaK [Afifella sp. IM 167]
MGEFEPQELQALGAAMQAELAELTALDGNSAEDRKPVELDQQGVGRLSRMDAMQVQAMAMASGRRRTQRIDALKAALARLESGEYGYCAICEEPIAVKRLKADPAARLCLACAAFEER